LAELFDKTAETIYLWISEGTIFPHAFKVRDGWYVPASDVKRLMKQRAEPTAALANEVPVRRSSGKGFVGGWK
jgi:predicted site-specific integrase-resolvase